MQDINHVGKPHGVNGSERITLKIVDDFQNGAAAESFRALTEMGSPPL
jgi:hypothetical protein